MTDDTEHPGQRDIPAPFNTVGCIAASPVALGLIYLAIKLTALLGWGVWPVPILVVLFALLLAAPIKTPSRDLSAGQKILFGLVAAGSVVTAMIVAANAEKATADLSPAGQESTARPSGSAPPPPPVTTGATVAEKTAAHGPLTVSPDTVLADYAENQIRAQKLYDREVHIAGKVVRVREALGTAILVLKSSDPDRPLDLYFTERAEPLLAEIRAGQRVTATCFRAIELAGTVALSDCRSVGED